MTEKHLHNKQHSPENDRFFQMGEMKWTKSQEEVWAELENQLKHTPGRHISLPHRHIISRAAAVAAILLVAFLGALFGYQKTIVCAEGQHQSITLPDGSRVEMNAESQLTYFPLQWKLRRHLHFDGEAFFQVEKGSPFVVESKNGNTKVLGTSFNIYARDESYRVTCLTGKVEVKTIHHQKAILTPNKHAELQNGQLLVTELFSPEKATSWRSNSFYFKERPLIEVIQEIQRQYAVTIELQPQLYNRKYTSSFTKKTNVEEVLNLVCKPMQLKFVKKSDNEYVVVANNS